jgi:sialate O-acetylesterase
MRKSLLALSVFCICTFIAQAQIRLPYFFSDNMVLQRNTAIPIWGWASASEEIVVQLNKQTQATIADKNGKWMVRLKAENAGGPYSLNIKGNKDLQLKNELIGDVWLCSGQSNMEWTVGQSDNAKNEIAAASYPFIRHIKIQRALNGAPLENTKETNWNMCDSNTVANFTAVGYFFARNMYNNTKVPIGLINSSWGGTNIETWISREGFESSLEFKELIKGIGKLNLDSINSFKYNKIANKVETIQNTKLKNLDANNFKDADYNDIEWPVMNVPQVWEQQSLGEVDGIIWLRKTINLSADEIKGNAIIELAKIDDDDDTYVNGVKIGSTNGWDRKRKYTIASGILKEGKNLIAVRIVDGNGNGGIYCDSIDAKISLANRIISLAGNWKFQVEKVTQNVSPNSFPSICYNAMIAPLVPFAFKGVLWYQGESNATRAYQYRTVFPLLINDWREKFSNKNAPFYFVQLASYEIDGNSNAGCSWAELREAQLRAIKVPNTGMVVTTDLVTDPKDIHPTNKQDVGKRLSAIALHNLFGKRVVFQGPTYKSMQIVNKAMVLYFDNVGTCLYSTVKEGKLNGFEIAGADSVFYPAQAVIKGNTVILKSDKVQAPLAAAFGWRGDASACNLFNREGFPAVPFRTDEWKNISRNEKYIFESN